eukprot:4044174-Pyramimonas_sp.AAC.1
MRAREGQPIGRAQDVLLLRRAEGGPGGVVVVDLGLGQVVGERPLQGDVLVLIGAAPRQRERPG